MSFALQAVLIGYVLLWAVLFLCCWRKREFCPVFADSRKTRRFWLATFILVNPVLTVLYLFFGQLRSPEAKPIRAVRDIVFVVAIAGFFLNIPGLTHFWMQPLMGRSRAIDPATGFRLATIRTNQGAEATTVDAGYPNRCLACRHIVMMIDGKHPLLYRVGSELAKRLEQLPIIETVEVRPDRTYGSDGARSPDLFIRLYLDDLREIPIPYSTRLNARVGLELNTVPVRCTDYRREKYSPPLADFCITMNVSQTSTTTGYESIRYAMAGRDIAEDFTETITKQLGKLYNEHRLLPELPESFYGDYTANELPDPLKELKPLQIASYSGLLRHNETYYQFALADEPAERLVALHDAMTAQGWTRRSGNMDSVLMHLRMRKDDRHIYIFEILQNRPLYGQRTIAYSLKGKPKHVFGIIDTESFNEAERNQALDDLMAQSEPLDDVLLFEPFFDAGRQEQLASLLEKHPSHNALACIKLAESYQNQDLPEKSLETMRLARALLWAERHRNRYQGRLKSLAIQLGDAKLADIVPTRQDFIDAGFTEFDRQVGALEFETDLNTPVRIFLEDARGDYLTQSLVVVRHAKWPDRFTVNHVTSSQQSSGFGSHGGFDRPWSCVMPLGISDFFMSWHISQIGQTPRFKISATER